ncbi:MAG: HAMP domain-containing protein [Acidobacteria bacterium]|nr:HAMP domain-containing protein [Acidobacteriota bacterium]
MAQLSGFAQKPREDGSKTRRYIMATIAFLFLGLIATQLFLRQTSVGSPRFVRMTFFLYAATALVILALLILATVLGRNLIKLYFERRSGQVGSRFKSKMVSTFVVLSLLPAVLLFLLAYGLINFSIEQWFSAPADQMLENSRSIAMQYYAEAQQRALRAAEVIASKITNEEQYYRELRPRLDQMFTELRVQYSVDGLRLFATNGALVAESGARVSHEDADGQVKRLVERAFAGHPDAQVGRIEAGDPIRELVRAAVPVRNEAGRIIGAILTESRVPESVNFKAYSVLEAYRAYNELQAGKTELRFNFLLILALSTLLIVFAFSWFAMYLAKRITVPIQALAEGAAAVATGNLEHRVECEAFGELEDLIQSFNRMTADLKENKARIEAAQDNLRRTNVELDDRRRYIETILQTIATGVISLDGHYRVRTMNRAAMQMLQVQGTASEVGLEEVLQGPALNTLRLLLHKSAVLGPVVRNIELALSGKTLHLAATVTPLLDSSGQRTGWVVVLDDVTELLRIEKMTAWQEVARRMAHEIKNPLTPIQLSAERLVRRYRQIWADDRIPAGLPAAWEGDLASFNTLLEECARTITQEAASLKNLVDEFSRFARMPAVKLEDADLHRVLLDTLSLYDGRIQDIQVVKTLAPDVPLLRLDPEQMRRVFVNLFDNALEAMAGSAHQKVLEIRTFTRAPQRSVRIEISDTGRGFPKEYQDSLFLPYFSTRKGGTGLGLAIVRQIINDHHGYVHAEPNSPLGTRIIIDLPLAPA